MSQQLISHNPDLKRLRDEGYSVRIVSNHLVVEHVPYVTPNREFKLGILVSCLQLAGDKTSKPTQHIAMFIGEHPCKEDGSKLAAIAHNSSRKAIGPGLVVDHSFSNKPREGYEDYYHKMSTYCAIISAPAKKLDPSATERPYLPVAASDEEESVFRYLDTASSRAGTAAVTEKLRVPRVGIVGLGGTGAYILDLIVKTPVGEIHLFDGDQFLSHNAFRAPGAVSIEKLRETPGKVDHFKAVYSVFRDGIVAHNCFVDETNMQLLDEMHSVFLCMDGTEEKMAIIEHLELQGIPFIDTGMGVELNEGRLAGIVRVTTSTPEHREHVHKNGRISFGGGRDNPYDTNIQVADLNALNASLAVIKWKKLLGFYRDVDREYHCLYTIDGNNLLSEDKACPGDQI